MKKPRILISGGLENPSNYEAAVTLAGGEPIYQYCPPPDTDCEGLLLTGGGDIDPSLLAEPDQGSREIDLKRDRAEFLLVREFAAKGKPILGICRGHQVVNIAFGGKLLQDIEPKLEYFHSPEPFGNRQDVYHPVEIREGSLMESLYGRLVIVNSWHHQAVKQPGSGFRVTAWSETGMIEATEHEVLPIFTAQFHPERMWAVEGFPALADGSGIFSWLIDTCLTQRSGSEEEG